MDLTQATQMLTWLDEEHRRQKAQLTELQERLEGQATQITALMKGLEDLEGRLTRTQAQLVKFPQIEQALQQLKNEIVLLLQRHEEQHQQADAEAAKVRLVEKEREVKALSGLRQQIEGLLKLEKAIESQQGENRRLREAISALQQQVADLAKRDEDQAAKLHFLEEREKQSAQQMAELQLFEEKLREDQARMMEKQRLNEQRRRKQMAEWAKEIEGWRKGDLALIGELQRLKKQHEESEKVLAALRKLERDLKRTQGELVHLQRLGEERQRKRIEEWQEAEGKRWAQNIAEWQRRWEEQSKRDEDLAARIKQLEEQRKRNQAQIGALLQTQEEHARRQIAEMEQLIGEMREHIGEDVPARRRAGTSEEAGSSGEEKATCA